MIEPLGNLFFRIGVSTNELDSGLKTAESKISQSALAWRDLMASALAAVGLGQIGAMAKEWMNEFIGAEQAQARLVATIKATGATAGFTADELATYASELESVTTFADDDIVNTMAKLLTFRSVSGDVFKSATELALDLAAEGFGSAESAAVMLGKALENPKRGLQSLTRVGVSFSEEQRQEILGYVASNQLLKAQESILNAVRVQVGGVARAQGATDAGRWIILNHAIGNTKEILGQAVIPIFLRLAEAKLVAYRAGAMLGQVFIALDKATGGALSTGIAMATVIASITVAMYTLQAALQIYNATMGVTITLMGMLKVISGWGAVAIGVGLAIGGIVVALRSFIEMIGQTVSWQAEWANASAAFGEVWTNLKSIVGSLAEIIGSNLLMLINAFGALFGLQYGSFGEAIGAVLGGITTAIAGLAADITNGMRIVLEVWNYTWQAVAGVINTVIGVIAAAMNFLWKTVLAPLGWLFKLVFGWEKAGKDIAKAGRVAATGPEALGDSVKDAKVSMVGIEDLWMNAVKEMAEGGAPIGMPDIGEPSTFGREAVAERRRGIEKERLATKERAWATKLETILGEGKLPEVTPTTAPSAGEEKKPSLYQELSEKTAATMFEAGRNMLEASRKGVIAGIATT